ncbi:MAG: hypothetical protein ABIK31_00360 [candidate division WOR-3 bacterium]
MEKGYFLDKARRHLSDGRGVKESYMPTLTKSDSAYYNQAFPEGYGKELSSRMRKVKAIGRANTFYKPIYAGYYEIIPSEVRKSNLSPLAKKDLIRTAGYAWEIRAEKDEETGKVYNYFVLRDDIELDSIDKKHRNGVR